MKNSKTGEQVRHKLNNYIIKVFRFLCRTSDAFLGTKLVEYYFPAGKEPNQHFILVSIIMTTTLLLICMFFFVIYLNEFCSSINLQLPICPRSPTPTPTSTPTPIDNNPPPPVNENDPSSTDSLFKTNCISINDGWIARDYIIDYLKVVSSNPYCWQMDGFGIFPITVDNHNGLMLANENLSREERLFHSIYKEFSEPIPDKLAFEIRMINTNSHSDEISEIYIGLGSKNDWLIKNGAFVFFEYPLGTISFNDRLNGSDLTSLGKYKTANNIKDNITTVEFVINKTVINIYVENDLGNYHHHKVMNSIPNGIWIGYNIIHGGNIEAIILEKE